MKKLLLILLCLPIIGFGQEQINIIDVKGYHYNDILNNMIECNLSIKYDETNQVTYFYISETISTVAYSLSKEDVFRLNEIFEKYFEWEKKAIEMKVKLDKSIDDRLFIGWFKYGNGDWANSKNKNCSFNALFFSQSEEKHQLVFQLGKITDYSNKYNTHNPQTIYLSKSQVSSLRKGFSKDYISMILDKEKEQKSIEDMFK